MRLRGIIAGRLAVWAIIILSCVLVHLVDDIRDLKAHVVDLELSRQQLATADTWAEREVRMDHCYQDRLPGGQPGQVLMLDSYGDPFWTTLQTEQPKMSAAPIRDLLPPTGYGQHGCVSLLSIDMDGCVGWTPAASLLGL